MKKIILKIGGMSCSACSSGLEKYLNSQEGVINASVNLVLAQAYIEYEDSLTVLDLERFIKERGYESLGIFNENEEEDNNKKDKTLLFIFLPLAILILYIAMADMFHLPTLKLFKNHFYYALTLLILTLPFLWYGLDIFKSGIKNLIHKNPNMDTLVTLGVFSSFIISLVSFIMIILGKMEYHMNLYFESVAIIIFFIKLGRIIDKESKGKTKEAIKELVQITPTKALKKDNDKEIEITIDEVKKGDILIAKPGMKIAVDGVIVNGETHLDEAFITGESKPVKKAINDKVVAGSLNIDGYFEYRAEKIGRDSTISEIVKLVVEATNTKTGIQRLADKVSSYFVPFIMLIAFLTLIVYLILGNSLNQAVITMATVLVVACPCALGLATPLAMVISIGTSAKNGILIKSSEILEEAYKVDTIVFDKTGTLTYGNLKISDVKNYSKKSDKDLIKLIASLEKKSTHPIAKAFKEQVSDKDFLNVQKFQNISGIGVKGIINNKEVIVGNNKLFKKFKLKNNYLKDEKELASFGNSIVYLIEDKQVLGLFGVKDIIRTEAKRTIMTLKKMGKEIIMLTGDNLETANIISKSLGIDKVISNVMPAEKTKIIKDLIKNNHKVMMIGDGINDAPSLKSATVGVSINSGTDIAVNSSDIILMNDNLEKIPLLLNISSKTMKNIRENLFWAFFYNVCMIPIAIGVFKPFGISMNPMFAGIAMTISSITVLLNSLRLKKIPLDNIKD